LLRLAYPATVKQMRLLVLLYLATILQAWSGEARLSPPIQYSGMSDASAGVAVSSNLFLVANDEDNTLRLYRTDSPGAPIREYNLNDFLDLHGKSNEADLEGAAKIGSRAFWIGSHGRSKDAKVRPNRCRLFATDIKMVGTNVELTPIGKPYKDLVNDLVSYSRLDKFHFAKAARKAPKEPDALDIEGLSATPEGHLLIGFRNPIPEGKALLIPLLNPNDVIAGKKAKFGDAIQLDMGELGIRDIAYHDGSYLIVAGPYDSHGKFHFYHWSGRDEAPQIIHTGSLKPYSPEGIIIYPEKGLKEFQILSDDGTRVINGTEQKDLLKFQQTFRSFWVTLGGAN
jgi:Protein of unknown function (DUF3616)